VDHDALLHRVDDAELDPGPIGPLAVRLAHVARELARDDEPDDVLAAEEVGRPRPLEQGRVVPGLEEELGRDRDVGDVRRDEGGADPGREPVGVDRLDRVVKLPTVAALEAVLFDVGDTLLWLDDAAIAAAAGVDAAAVPPAIAAVRRAVDAAVLPALEAGRAAGAPIGVPEVAGLLLAELGVPPARRPAAVDRLLALDRAFGLWCVVPPDAGSTLEALARRGLRVAAVSNSDGTVAEKLRRAGLADRFEAILDSDVEGVAKPDPELFRRALSGLGVAPERAVYVGDVYSLDVVGSERAGLRGILLDRTGCYAPPGCERVTALGELLDVL